MFITRLRIRNFRCIRGLDLDLGPTTVLVGPNNVGKTAILDAVRIALTRRWGQHGTGFVPSDIHLRDAKDDPKTAQPVRIELEMRESRVGEWPENLVAALDDIIQIDPAGQNLILLGVSYGYNPQLKAFEPRWEFLGADRKPLVGRGARATNLQEFFQYMPAFYLSALRDADDEFSPRSQFWGRLLRSLEIPEKLQARLQRVLDRLNSKLLTADPRLPTIAEGLRGITRVTGTDQPGDLDLRAVPLKAWDMLSRTEMILRSEPSKPWLPLSSQGQGVQSLSVLFLFDTFVRVLLTEVYKPESTPVLALEEPETHLHPQGARALCASVLRLNGQKLITTHSPYFVQTVPFRDLRLLRLSDTGTTAAWLPRTFSVEVPLEPSLDVLIRNSAGKLSYEQTVGVLTVRGKLEKPTYRDLLACFGTHGQRVAICSRLRELRDRSRSFVSDADLEQLEQFARRIRGEIFFARKWILVEGQTDYVLMHALADALEYGLDEHGVAVIDAQNNGNPGIFAALARSLRIPWLACFDGDAAGRGYLEQIQDRDFDESEVRRRCACLAHGNIERQLVLDGLEPELRTILKSIGQADADDLDQDALVARLEASKTEYSNSLASMLRTTPELSARMPAPFRDMIKQLPDLAV